MLVVILQLSSQFASNEGNGTALSVIFDRTAVTNNESATPKVV